MVWENNFACAKKKDEGLKIAQEIESAIRTKAGLISKKIEGNPAPKEKETEK